MSFERGSMVTSRPDAAAAPVNWADAEDLDEIQYEDGEGPTDEKGPDVPPPRETITQDKDGNMITALEEWTVQDGKKIKLTKVTRRVTKEIRMPKTVSQRRSWKKFGEANGGRGGPQGQMEQGITMKTAEEVVLTLKHDALLGHDKREEMMNKQHKSADSIVVCRNCGRVGDHWTLKCPYAKMDGDGALGDEAVGEPGAGGAYVAPARKKGAGEALTAGDSMRGGDRDFATLRVSNLSEETQEADLDALFRPFGPVARIYLAKDKYTNLSRGFGFINYHRREDAQRAMDKLNGYGFDNLILSVQFAEPREDRPDDRPREGRGMQAHSERY